MALPPCGLYRTTREVAGVPAGRLVYFHNHGEPGAGIYLPQTWSLNRASWNQRGHTLANDAEASNLAPLPSEGLYVVNAPFHCCDKKCVRFEPNTLVQLGYDGEATPLLFRPELSRNGMGFPERGTRLDANTLGNLTLLSVAKSDDAPRDPFTHLN